MCVQSRKQTKACEATNKSKVWGYEVRGLRGYVKHGARQGPATARRTGVSHIKWAEVGTPHLHKVAFEDGEVAQLIELAAQEVALEAPRAARGVGWKQGAVCRSEGLASAPGGQVRVPWQGAHARQRPPHCRSHAFPGSLTRAKPFGQSSSSHLPSHLNRSHLFRGGPA